MLWVSPYNNHVLLLIPPSPPTCSARGVVHFCLMIEQTDETHVYAIAPAEGRFEMAGRTNHAGHAEIIRFRAVCVRAIQVMVLGYNVDTHC